MEVQRTMNMAVTSNEVGQKSLYHDATNSWNGYSHQGKAALYTVLFMINDLTLQRSLATSYELEIEYLEDFTIYFQGKEHSIHQVKTYNSTAPSEYKDAIWTLLGKTAMKSTITNAFLHTSEELLKKEDLKPIYLSLVAPQASNSKTQLSPFDYYKYVIDNGLYDECYEKFSLFSYEDNKCHCSITRIQEAVIFQIKEYYSKREIFRSDEHINRLFYYLLALLDKHVSERHNALQHGLTSVRIKRISFDTFFEALDKDFEVVSKQHYTYVLRELFTSVGEQFLYYQTNIDEDAYSRVVEFFNSVQKIDDDLFLKLCKKWTPHVNASELDLKSFHGLIPVNGIRDPLLKAHCIIREAMDNNNSVFIKRDSTGLNLAYLPTTINDKPMQIMNDDLLDEVLVGQMAEKIMLNSDIDDLHEVDVLISSFISMTSLEEAASKMTDVNLDADVHDEYKEEEKFMKIKRIRMIPFSKAREELDT
ncbi:hypothetical protein EBB07_15465 [Paenibacillaceae bacterium]|nr:hypothetical protein EBB07_15465 [Paenibacillaceae bacterium]